MPRYFFNTKVNGHSTIDAFGLDLMDDTAAREAACRIARRMADVPHDPSECFVYVTRESGQLAFRIPIDGSDPVRH